MIKLKSTKTFRVCNSVFKIIATYDHAAGKRNRYTVLILTATEPIVIGRELDLPFIKKYVRDIEKRADKENFYWTGEYKSALKFMQREWKERRKL